MGDLTDPEPLLEVAIGTIGLVVVMFFHGISLRFINRHYSAAWVRIDATTPHWRVNLLLAAVGAESGVTPAVTAAVGLLPGDALLVCSDGLWEWIDEAAMLAALPGSGRSDDWLSSMCAAAATAAASQPEVKRDNFSAYAIRVHAREGEA